MARKGPVTKDTSALALGLAQVRIGASLTNIASTVPVLTASNSIGAMMSTKFSGDTKFFEHMSGFPKQMDYAIVIEESAALECKFEEITPFNLALAAGIDPGTNYPNVHSGEIALGGKTAPEYVRMEAEYVFPNGINKMTVIFPRAQVKSSVELDMQAEDTMKVPVTFQANNSPATSPAVARPGTPSLWA